MVPRGMRQQIARIKKTQKLQHERGKIIVTSIAKKLEQSKLPNKNENKSK